MPVRSRSPAPPPRSRHGCHTSAFRHPTVTTCRIARPGPPRSVSSGRAVPPPPALSDVRCPTGVSRARDAAASHFADHTRTSQARGMTPCGDHRRHAHAAGAPHRTHRTPRRYRRKQFSGLGCPLDGAVAIQPSPGPGRAARGQGRTAMAANDHDAGRPGRGTAVAWPGRPRRRDDCSAYPPPARVASRDAMATLRRTVRPQHPCPASHQPDSFGVAAHHIPATVARKGSTCHHNVGAGSRWPSGSGSG